MSSQKSNDQSEKIILLGVLILAILIGVTV